MNPRGIHCRQVEILTLYIFFFWRENKPVDFKRKKQLHIKQRNESLTNWFRFNCVLTYNKWYNFFRTINSKQIVITPLSRAFFQELAFDPNKSMRNRIYIAYCVPHTCNSGDVSKHMESILRDIPQKKITTNVGTVKCQKNTALPWTWGDYTFLYVLLIKYYINNIELSIRPKLPR